MFNFGILVGCKPQRQSKAWRGKFFVFLSACRVPPTNNISEREIRPSVIFRKVTNGFRSDWGPGIHVGYRSATERGAIDVRRTTLRVT